MKTEKPVSLIPETFGEEMSQLVTTFIESLPNGEFKKLASRGNGVSVALQRVIIEYVQKVEPVLMDKKIDQMNRIRHQYHQGNHHPAGGSPESKYQLHLEAVCGNRDDNWRGWYDLVIRSAKNERIELATTINPEVAEKIKIAISSSE